MGMFSPDENGWIKAEEYEKLKQENEQLKKMVKVRMEDLCLSCGASSMMPLECEILKDKLNKINNILEVYYDDDWKATREIEKVLNEYTQYLKELEDE